MIGRTNTGGGGGGGLSPNSAIIHVTAPVGSTISFSKGGVVVKVLGADKSHINAVNNDVAEWYYSVSSANYGTWTVVAELSSASASATVSVGSAYQYNVALSYELYLIKNGVAVNGFTWTGASHRYDSQTNAGVAPTITAETGYIKARASTTSTKKASLYYSSSIESVVGGYSYLNIKCKRVLATNQSCTIGTYVESDTLSYNNFKDSNTASNTADSEPITIQIPLTSASISAPTGICVAVAWTIPSSGASTGIDIYDVYLTNDVLT